MAKSSASKAKRKDTTKKRRKRLLNLGIVLCALVIALCLYQLIPMWIEYSEGNSAYKEFEQGYLTTVEPDSERYPKPSFSLAPGQTPPAYVNIKQPSIAVDFERLREINPDVVAWIYCKDTAINYPVVQGADNDYYLHFLFDKKRNSSGSIFMDYRNMRDFSNRNTIVYGHRMNNGSMFASLLGYKEQSYYELHPFLELYTPDGFYIIEVFSAYTTSAQGEYVCLDFADDVAFEAYLQEIKAASKIEIDVPISAEDRVVMLSTCEKGADTLRFTVQCKLVPVWVY